MSALTELYTKVILSEEEVVKRGRGRPPKDAAAHAAKVAARQKEHGVEGGEETEANQHPVVQLMKAADAPEKPHEMSFADGPHPVHKDHAMTALKKYAGFQGSDRKLAAIKFLKGPHTNLYKFIGKEHSCPSCTKTEDAIDESTMPSTAVGAKCKNCGEGHKASGKVMMDGYHSACKSVAGKAANYVKETKDEPSCPKCGHYNAMLSDIDHPDRKKGIFNNLKCRDCGHKANAKDLKEGALADKLAAKKKENEGKPKKKLDFFKKYKRSQSSDREAIEKRED